MNGGQQSLLDKKKRKKPRWTCCHTLIGLFIARVWADVLGKNMNVFYMNYASELNLTTQQFTIILTSQYIGWIISMFTSSINNKMFPSSRSVSSFYLLLDGTFALLFILPFFFGNNLFNQWSPWQTILYCSCMWALFGIAYPTNKSAVVGMSSDFSLKSERGRNISYLGMSWAFATLIFVPIGYMIDYVDWWSPFLILGSMCLIASPIVLVAFPKKISSAKSVKAPPAHQSSKSRELFLIFCKSKVCMLILWAHTFSALACGSIETAISGPWLQDVYGFSVHETGYIGFVIFAGETVGTLMMACFSDRWGVWIFSVLCYCIFFVSALIICLASLFFGNDAGGLYVPIAVNFFYFVGWKIFWSALQVAIATYSEAHIQNRTIFSANHSMTAVGRIPGVFLTTYLWDNGNGITMLSYVWMGAILISAALFFALYFDTKRNPRKDTEYSRTKTTNTTITKHLAVNGMRKQRTPKISTSVYSQVSTKDSINA